MQHDRARAGSASGKHLVDDRVGGAEEDHSVEVHDQARGAKLLEHVLLRASARHLGAFQEQRGVLQHA